MKKNIVMFLILVLIFGTMNVFAVDFTDMKGHWSGIYVNELVAKGAIGGFPDGSFKPDGIMTRAQYIKILISALGYTVTPAKSGYWAKPYIDKAIELGGIDLKEFTDYDQAISRDEMARIMIRTITDQRIDNAVAVLKSLKDHESIPQSQKYYIANAVGLGLMTGYSDGSFGREKSATRGEASTVIARILEKSYRKLFKGDVLMTAEQVARHNFRTLPTGYISYKEVVYDVSGASQWASGSHSGFSVGGSIDGSSAIDHILSKLPGLKVVGKLLTKNFYIDITSAEAFNKIENNKNLQIVDVSPAFSQGHLPGAVSIPLGILASKVGILDVSKPVLVYCHNDEASQEGAKILIAAGFSPVYRLAGNFSGWQSGGYPVEK
jgi:rhodanese-related sulfurtransferase/predicted heme/steroid binding protein